MRKNSKTLLEADPEGAKEWDYEKNTKLGFCPDKILSKSVKKVWWLCSKNHSYDATVANHTQGSRCPYCANKKVLSGFNDLKSIDPEGVKEWDYEKNAKLGFYPDKILSKSGKKVWWLCSKNHSYSSKVILHTNGQRCPYCTNKKVLSGFNDLATLDPEGVKEWDYEKNTKLGLKPDFVASKSKIKVWWICPKNHSYDMVIRNHTEGQRCPYCANIRVLSGFNDLVTKDPEGAKEWDYEKNAEIGFYPDKIAPNMMKPKLYWKCQKGHSYMMIANSHTNGHRCPICSNSTILSGFNDLVTLDPEGAKEWDYEKNAKLGLKPDFVASSTNQKVWWICPKNHSYKARIADHTKGSRCPYCANKKALSGFNDLATIDLEGAKEWDYEKNAKLGFYSDKILPRSNKKAWWICPKNHSYDMVIDYHTAGQRCPFCANVRLLSGFNDLATLDPEGVKEWDYEKNAKLGFYPNKIAPNMMKPKLYWKCQKGHSYMMSANNHSYGHRCPICNESKGEKRIKEILECLGVENIPQYTFNDCRNKKSLPFDFAIIKNNKPVLLIEYDGLQHFQPVRFGGISEELAKANFEHSKLRDNIKTKYCKKKKIPLLRIPYTDYDNMEEILSKELSKYEILI